MHDWETPRFNIFFLNLIFYKFNIQKKKKKKKKKKKLKTLSIIAYKKKGKI